MKTTEQIHYLPSKLYLTILATKSLAEFEHCLGFPFERIGFSGQLADLLKTFDEQKKASLLLSIHGLNQGLAAFENDIAC